MTTFWTKNRGLWRSAVLVAAAAIALFGCSSDGESPLTTADLTLPSTTAGAPDETAPEETTPPETAPPETTPAEPAPAEPAPADDSLTNQQWIFITLGVLLLLGLLVTIAVLLARRNDAAAADPPQ